MNKTPRLLLGVLLTLGILWPRAPRADQVIATRAAHFDRVVATGAPSPPLPLQIDIRSPVQVGWGYSRPFRSRVLTIGFHDELSVVQVSRSVQLDAVFGMDGQRTVGRAPRRSFVATALGAGMSVRAGSSGPLFVASGTFAPLWQSRGDSSHLAGFGVGIRAEAYPFYQTIAEAVGCRRGTVATYVLSGLNGWAEVRQDWLGSSGTSYSVGFGIDLGREVVLPILGAAFHGSCSR